MSLWGDMPWQPAALVLLAALLVLGGLIAIIVGWIKAVRRDIGRFEPHISSSEINAHRVTPRFRVGEDAKS